jgi:hypothetical protein
MVPSAPTSVAAVAKVPAASVSFADKASISSGAGADAKESEQEATSDIALRVAGLSLLHDR